MKKNILFTIFGLILSAIYISTNIFLINAVVYNSNKVLFYTFATLIFNFIFSVCYTNLFVIKTYEKIFIKATTNFMNSNSFNSVSKGEYLQKLVDYPQNFMFLYGTALELSANLITLIITMILLPKNIIMIILYSTPLIILTILVFLIFRKDEESLFKKRTVTNQFVSNSFLNYINGLDNLRGIGKEQYICDQLYKNKIDATKANMSFSLNQHIQKSIFEYTSFIPVIALLLINYIFPNFLKDYNIIGCIIAVKLILSFFYNFISEIIELKLYLMYKIDFEKWQKKLSITEKPVVICDNITISLNENLNLFMKHFKINDGDFIQLHGDSGSGKSCFIEFLMGLRNSVTGVSSYTNEDIAYVGQKSYVFYGSFWENMLKDCSEEEMNNIKDIWNHLNLSRDFENITAMNNIQKNISSGQEILVSFSRALVSNAHYIFLDEIDKNISDDIADHLFEICKNKFNKVIAVSHETPEINFATKHVYIKSKNHISNSD